MRNRKGAEGSHVAKNVGTFSTLDCSVLLRAANKDLELGNAFPCGYLK